MNAYNLLQAQMPVGQAFVPSTGTNNNLFDPNQSISVSEFHPEGVVIPNHSETAVQQTHAFQQQFNPIIPTIMESTQPGSSQGIVDSLKAAGYPVQDVSATNGNGTYLEQQPQQQQQ